MDRVAAVTAGRDAERPPRGEFVGPLRAGDDLERDRRVFSIGQGGQWDGAVELGITCLLDLVDERRQLRVPLGREQVAAPEDQRGSDRCGQEQDRQQ